MPVKSSRPWQDSPATMRLQPLMDHVQRTAKRLLGVLIAAVVGIVTVMLLLLRPEWLCINLCRPVNMLELGIGMLNSYGLLKDKLTLYCKVANLQQAVVLLGDQIVSLQKWVQLKCDRNSTSFCITPVLYNESMFEWDKDSIFWGTVKLQV